MVLTLLALLWSALVSAPASAGPADTSDALDRLEEILELRIDDGLLDAEALQPAILVSSQPRYEASQAWYAARVIEVLERSLGADSLRLCEACMAPRAFVAEGSLTWQTGPVSLDDVVRLDDQSRGDAPPARSAIWLDEHRGGVAVRIVDLRTARVIFAQNVDPNLVEYDNTQRAYGLSEELERRSRGDSVTQTFVDFALYPGQHLSLDWTDQWGPTNSNLSGLTISVLDPIVGIGACHYKVTPLFNTMVGGQVLISLPTAITRSVGDSDEDALDPLLNVAGVVRVPFGRSNYGGVLTVSTNGVVGLGISLMNIRFLPVLL